MVVTWSAFIYKLCDLRRDPRNVVLRSFCTQLALTALTFTLAWPPIAWRIERYSGILAIWSTGTCVIGCAATQMTLLLWTYPAVQAWPKVRLWLPIYGVAFAAMLALDLSAPIDLTDVDLRAHAETPERLYAATPHVAQSLLIFLAVLAFTSAWGAMLLLRYARLVDRPWLRRGLRVIAGTAVGNVGYSAASAMFVIASRSGVTIAIAQRVTTAIAGFGMLVTVVGITMPVWGPRLDRLRAYRKLHPLWLALCQAAPGVVLDPPRSPRAGRWRLDDLDFRLHRRVIEIRDSRLALRPYMDKDAVAAAHQLAEKDGLEGVRLNAVVEAAALAAALRAKARQHYPVSTPENTIIGGTDLDAELAWLTRVAQAFDESPVVAAVATLADATMRAAASAGQLAEGMAS
jgi:hypothetical protein